jgi:hypothetical protein
MITIRACATPNPKSPGVFKLPKRLSRARRVAESKRLDTFREIHEALKKTAKDEQAFVKDFFSKTNDMWDDLTKEAADDEEEAENADE